LYAMGVANTMAKEENQRKKRGKEREHFGARHKQSPSK